jgi:polyisoprenoid-binding protein YceI
MNKILFLLLLLGPITGKAQQLTPRDAGSSVKFSIKNFGLNVTGSFKNMQGKINFNPANTAASSFEINVDATTVNTGNESRDKHLKKKDYFDVDTYSKLFFLSTKVSAVNGNYIIEGILTIKGVAKKISFSFTATPQQKGYLFTGQFKLNRRDFGVGGSSWVLSDDLTVQLNVLAQ